MSERGRRVLVAEDDPMVAVVLKRLLQARECSLERFEDGHAALSRLEEVEFDAMITDLKMPGLGGLELLRRVRARGLELPVVVISGFATLPEEEEIRTLGAELVRKPFLPRQIWQALGL